MEALGSSLRTETALDTLAWDAIKTSEIEGEVLDQQQVRSSLARRLGLEQGGLSRPDRKADAIAAVVLDATHGYDEPLTSELLFTWHRSLFPSPGRGRHPMTIGGWRTDEYGAMVVTSGPTGRETIHFEAPPASRVPSEMDAFLTWFEADTDALDPVLKAVVAHL